VHVKLPYTGGTHYNLSEDINRPGT